MDNLELIKKAEEELQDVFKKIDEVSLKNSQKGIKMLFKRRK